MLADQSDSVLFYGSSICLEMIESRLRRTAQFDIIRIDPRQAVAAQQLPNLRASILVYDQNYTDTDLVSAFMLKNPNTLIVALGPDSDQAELFSASLSSQRQMLGLAQVLQILCDQPQPAPTDR